MKSAAYLTSPNILYTRKLLEENIDKNHILCGIIPCAILRAWVK